MDENIFSKEYISHLQKLAIVERVYNVTPNPANKKMLTDLQSVTFTAEQRFTPEYMREYRKNKKESQNEAENEIKHLLNSLHIEEQFADGKISFDKRVELHERNNQKFNKSYIK